MSLSRSAVLSCTLVLGFTQASFAQTSQPTSQPARDANPALPGFDEAGSDAKAIALADATMEKMGGRQAWEETRFITWKFFGSRFHLWDKHTGDIRIETENRDGQRLVLLSNLHTGKGKAFIDGEPVTDKEELSGMMQRAKSWWINDSYWLVMPYKLKDSGVTLTYVGEKAMTDERAADVLQLTFTEVGDTPGNKYHVYIAKDSGLVEQWDFYRNADDAEAGFKIPWHNWVRHGGIMLSADRGMRRGNPSRHTDVGVFEKLPRSMFESPEPVDFPEPGDDDATSMNAPLDKLAPLLGSWEGTFSIHGPDHEVVDAFAIRWESALAFDGRYLRFEFTSVEPRGGRYSEFVGLFTPSEDGRSLETVWISPSIRKQTDRFLTSQMIFMESGTFDSSETILTLFSDHQYGPDTPVIRYKSVFTLEGAERFTIVDSALDEETGDWTPKYTFALVRR